jgi:hypothetical protein
MRRLIVATLTAVLVVIGLSAVLLGTASAATPVPSELSTCAGLRAELATAKALTVDDTAPYDAGTVTTSEKNRQVKAAEQRLRNDRCDGSAGNGNGNGHNGGGYGLPRYGSCSDYNRNGVYDIRRGDARYLDSWDRNRNGVACDRGDVIVSDDGRCVTFRDQNRDYGTRYNTTYNQRLDRARSFNSDGGTAITARERRDIEDAADLRDFRNRWTSTRDELRTICNDPTPEVQIITVPTPAPATVTAAPPAPPAPVTSSGGSVPSGHYNGGGDSVAYTLAHNRVA